jgi:hypothetical protein
MAFSAATAFVMPRYASRSNMTRHHREVINVDGRGHTRERDKIEIAVPRWSLTSTDTIFGRYSVGTAAQGAAAGADSG